MQMVRFVKPWRGHAMEAVAELTDERAAQLMREKYCVAHVTEAPVAQAPVEAPPEPQTVEAGEPESADAESEPETLLKPEEPVAGPPKRRRRAK